ncbi:MAG TPA: DMT family transporter [Chloroflexota bacterium]
MSALACAALWAGSTVAMRSQTGRVPVLAINTFRTGFAALAFWLVLLALGRLADVLAVPGAALGGLFGSVLFGMALGDSLHIRAMHAIGVSRAMPISSSYPLVTTLLAVVWLGEPVTPAMVLGVTLIVAGVYLVASPPRRVDGAGGDTAATRPGVLLALAASLCWATSTVMVRPALDQIDPLLANAIRLPAAFLVLALTVLRGARGAGAFAISPRSALVLAGAGLVSGVSGAFWLVGVRYAGAAKAAALSSTAPMFAAPLAVLLLGERLSPRVGLGTLVTIVGIWLVL